MDLDVRYCGDPILRKISSPVEEFDSGLRELAEAMIETMRNEDGIGLAAPQVGVSIRMIVALRMKGSDDFDAPPGVFVIPEIINTSNEAWTYEEGCLSLPGISASVERPCDVEIRYQDLEGEFHTISASDLFGRILLHEIDHLEGKLFIDYLSSAQKSLIKSKLKNLYQKRA
jgi:peptide deformylase